MVWIYPVAYTLPTPAFQLYLCPYKANADALNLYVSRKKGLLIGETNKTFPTQSHLFIYWFMYRIAAWTKTCTFTGVDSIRACSGPAKGLRAFPTQPHREQTLSAKDLVLIIPAHGRSRFIVNSVCVNHKKSRWPETVSSFGKWLLGVCTSQASCNVYGT